MDERVLQFRVGVVVLGALIVAGILLVFFGEMGIVGSQYTVFVRFREAPGVTVDTPVRKSGILIGRVSQVELNEDDTVDVTIRIDESRKLRSDEVCKITTGTLLGDAAIEFVPPARRAPVAEYLEDGDWMRGVVGKDPLNALEVFVDLEGQVRDVLSSIQVAGTEVGGVAKSLNAVVSNNQGQFQRILQKSEQAMDRFDVAVNAINAFVQDDRIKKKLEEALNNVPDLLLDASEVMASLKGVAARAEQNLANLEGLTEPLGERGEELTDLVEQSIRRLDTAMVELVSFSQAINNSDGTIAKLINDSEVYDRVNKAAGNIEEITRRMRPIVEDARVFADKIARDPGRIGVKGILDRRNSGTKY